MNSCYQEFPHLSKKPIVKSTFIAGAFGIILFASCIVSCKKQDVTPKQEQVHYQKDGTDQSTSHSTQTGGG